MYQKKAKGQSVEKIITQIVSSLLQARSVFDGSLSHEGLDCSRLLPSGNNNRT